MSIATTTIINRHIPESTQRCLVVASGEHYWNGNECKDCGAERVGLVVRPGAHGFDIRDELADQVVVAGYESEALALEALDELARSQGMLEEE